MIMTMRVVTINKSEGVYFEEPKVLYDDSKVVEVPTQALPYNEADRACIPGSQITGSTDAGRYTNFCAAYWAARCKDPRDRVIFRDLTASQVKDFVDDKIDSGMFTDESDDDKQWLFYNLYIDFLTCCGIYAVDPDKKLDVYCPGSAIIQTYPYKLTMEDNDLNSIDLPLDVQIGLIMEARWEVFRTDYLLYLEEYEVYVNRISDKGIRDEIVKFFTQRPKVGKPIADAPDEIKVEVDKGKANIILMQETYTLGDHEIKPGYPYSMTVDRYKEADEYCEDIKYIQAYRKVTEEINDMVNSPDFDMKTINYHEIFEKVKSVSNERLATSYVSNLHDRIEGARITFDEETNTWKKRW